MCSRSDRQKIGKAYVVTFCKLLSQSILWGCRVNEKWDSKEKLQKHY